MGKKDERTNVMRVLEEKKIEYTPHIVGEVLNAVEISQILNQPPEIVFKTLVTVGKSGEHYVFMVPAEKELDLKKAANVAKEKNIEMIPQKTLLPLTGYVHGGCSPIGMKKKFKTFIDASCLRFDKIFFSAGKIGYQVEVNPKDLISVFDVEVAEYSK